MPFRGMQNGHVVIPDVVDDGTAVNCPVCGGTMYPRSPVGKARHFYHVSDSHSRHCPSTGESDIHSRAVAHVEFILYQRFKKKDASITVETPIDVSDVPTPASTRRADVLLTFGGENPYFGDGLAVEVQHEHKDKDIKQVTHDYLSVGYSVVWIPAVVVLSSRFNYDWINAEFEREDGSGYAHRTSKPHYHINCESLTYGDSHSWTRVPSYAHPRGQDELITYDICSDPYCDLRRIHEPDGQYTYTKEDRHAPDFPIKALKNTIIRDSDLDPFWKWASNRYKSAQLEKLLALRPEIERCRGPKGFHEWGRKETLWTDSFDKPQIRLHKCMYCPVQLVTNHRGRREHSTFCLYGRDPPVNWNDVYFQASPVECDHYLYDENMIEDYCPKCGKTMTE